jgi:molecular chaperone GrpE (heat shock protein)
MGMFDSIGSFFGDAINTGVSIWNAEQNRGLQGDIASANRADAQANRDFQERMSNTSYQRMVTDLNAAGLSPMLAYSKGGASTPTGSVGTSGASGSSIEAPKFGETGLRQAQAEAAREQAQVAKSQIAVNGASAVKLAAEAENVRQDTENKKLIPGLNEAEIKELIARAGQHGASSSQLMEVIKNLSQERALRKPEEQFKAENPTVSKYMHPVQESLRTIFEGLGLLRGTSAMPNVWKKAQ